MCLFVFIHLSLGRRMFGMINLSCECFNTLVAIERSYLSVCQHVRVQISNSSASVFALTAFVRHLPHVRPHLYLKTWCVYAREVLVTFVCLFTSMCHLVFLQLMYILVCKSYHIGQTLSNT